MFVPQNVPTLLIPFLVIIELISHIAKVFSLAIRLFANMMSGHVLLHILTGFVLDLAKKNLLFTIFPLVLIMAIVLLEYGITVLQAYVFITLLSIYFEEHFGFAQVDSNQVSKLILINGQKISLTKQSVKLNCIMRFSKRTKGFYFIFRDKRKKKCKTKRMRFWDYTRISLILAK